MSVIFNTSVGTAINGHGHSSVEQSSWRQAHLQFPRGILFWGRHRCLGLPAALLIMVTQAFFLAARDPMTCLAAAALAGVANLAGDLWLCCGLDWGIAGASLATAVAQVGPVVGSMLARCSAALTEGR